MNTLTTSPAPCSQRRNGFTLIELLTVIAIIGILAAILIPVVGKVRDSAYSAKTVSNLRQLYQANRMHATDWKGLFCPIETVSLPPSQGGGSTAGFHVNGNFLNYLGNEKFNGWEDEKALMKSGKPSANGGNGVSLGIGMGRQTAFPRQFSFKDSEVDVTHPKLVMFGDSCNWVLSGDRARNAPESWADEDLGTFGAPAFRHDGKAHFVLATGNVVKLTKAEATNTADGNFARYWPTTGTGATTATNLKRHTAPY